MAEKPQSLKIQYPKKATGVLKLIIFLDNNHFVSYCPALQLSGYGENEKEAKAMMKVSLDDFWRNLFQLPEHVVYETLRNLGWSQDRLFKKKFQASAYVDKDGILRDFNLSEETEIKEALLTV